MTPLSSNLWSRLCLTVGFYVFHSINIWHKYWICCFCLRTDCGFLCEPKFRPHGFTFTFVDFFLNCFSFSDWLFYNFCRCSRAARLHLMSSHRIQENNLAVINHTVWAQLWHRLCTRSRTSMQVAPFVMTSVLCSFSCGSVQTSKNTRKGFRLGEASEIKQSVLFTH